MIQKMANYIPFGLSQVNPAFAMQAVSKKQVSHKPPTPSSSPLSGGAQCTFPSNSPFSGGAQSPSPDKGRPGGVKA